jgi:16S rRNA (guanine527-N7)-methyltransferase
MTEEEAQGWVRERFGVSRETALARFSELLLAEAQAQNLIAASTMSTVWARHLADSAQLIPLAEEAGDGTWIDIGSGAGLPGIVAALLTDRPVNLVEPRARRVEFLRHVAAELAIADRVTVHGSKIERYTPVLPAAIISARAVAALPELFAAARHCAGPSTIWLLPKGRNAQSEVEAARAKWQGSFHVEPSLTSSDSGIVVARGVKPR